MRESLAFAFRELLTNAIEWGGRLDPNRKVRIACLRTARMLMYRIADPGPGFNIDDLPHAAIGQPPGDPIAHMQVREEKGIRPGGFGLLMVRESVDELLYNEKRNEVVFVKYLDEGRGSRTIIQEVVMPSIQRELVLVALVLTHVSPARSAPRRRQPASAGPLVVMSIIDVKPEAVSEFGALQAEVMAAQRAGGQPWRETWHTATFGYPYRVAVLTPMNGLGMLDGQTYTAKGVGAAAATAINERARRLIANQQIYLVQVRPDLGIGVRGGKSTLGVVSYISVAPGREPEIEQVLKTEVNAALKKAGVSYYGVSRVVYGGDTSQYITLLMFENFADLGERPSTRIARWALTDSQGFRAS